MSQSKHILWLLFAGLAVGWLIGNLVPARKQKNYSKEYHALQDSLRQQTARDRDYWRGKYEKDIELANKRDTVLIREFKTNTIKYEKIPTTVNSLNDDELRRSVTGFGQ